MNVNVSRLCFLCIILLFFLNTALCTAYGVVKKQLCFRRLRGTFIDAYFNWQNMSTSVAVENINNVGSYVFGARVMLNTALYTLTLRPF